LQRGPNAGGTIHDDGFSMKQTLPAESMVMVGARKAALSAGAQKQNRLVAFRRHKCAKMNP
jgi:hypothetical protein